MTLTTTTMARLLGASALALSLAAGAAHAGKADDTLNVAFAAEPEPLDSYKIAGRQGLILARHIYDGLLYKDLNTGEFLPALAESYEYVEPLVMEFKLREGVKFHNGADFTADDVVTTFDMVTDPEYGTRYAIYVDWIDSVEKTDDYTVRINMSKPFAGALEMLADALPIYPHEFFAENGSEGITRTPIGTGPYKLVSQEPGVRYELEKFEDYYPEGPKAGASIGKIVVRTIPELNTQYAELMSGNLDWIWRIPPDQASRLESRVQVISAPIMRIAYVGFAPLALDAESPIAKQEVRQALIHAVNREAITKAFGGAGSEVLNTPCNPAQFGCEQDVTAYEYDPEKARQMLADAGYADGFEMEMVFAAMPRPVAEAVAADLAKVGVTLILNEQQYAAGVGQWRAKELPAFFSNWGSYGIGDAAFILSNFFGGGADDLIQDPQLAEWLTTADTASDREVRAENYSMAVKEIVDQAYWMPMYNFNVNYGLSPDLSFTPYPDEFARWWEASWK
ncbi:MAG: ABC transporter substrate-binding protein [Yangia sp.]|nr:ABC transporter substrate-binding protein [Salipiger sp.]